MEITCPYCGHVGTELTFETSLCDECFCPSCRLEFLLDDDYGEDE